MNLASAAPHNVSLDPLQWIVTFLVFQIGIPALSLQIMHSEIRRLVTKRPRLFIRHILFPIIACVAIVVLTAVLIVKLPENAVFLDTDLLDKPDQYWLVCFAIIFIITTLTSLITSNRYSRLDDIARMLSREIFRRRFRDILKSRTKSLRVQFCRAPLNDLVELGKNVAPGQDRDLVLNVLRQVAIRACKNPRYAGDSFEDFLNGINSIFISQGHPSTLSNYEMAATILNHIARAYRSPMHNNDLERVVQSISAISSYIVVHVRPTIFARELILEHFKNTLDLIVDLDPQLLPSVSRAFYEIGIEGLEHNQRVLASICIGELANLADRGNVIYRPEEVKSRFLGMLARYALGKFGTSDDQHEKAIPKMVISYIHSCLDQVRYSQLVEQFHHTPTRAMALMVQSELDYAQSFFEKLSFFSTADSIAELKRFLLERAHMSEVRAQPPSRGALPSTETRTA